MMAKKPKNLHFAKAAFDAFLGRDIAYFPRVGGLTLPAGYYLRQISDELSNGNFTVNDLKDRIERAEATLSEVKGLTEYQDQKSSRLLTIVAFLTAAAGAVFARVSDLYPLHPPVLPEGWLQYLVPASYAVFALFLFAVAFGALISFHATQARFVWPEDETDEATAQNSRSFLFYQSIVRTDPQGWAKGFLVGPPSGGTATALDLQYLKNYVAESYLVAAKVGDKLRYLGPAQLILQWSIRLLIVWLSLLVLTFAFVPQAPKSGDIAGAAGAVVARPVGTSAEAASDLSAPSGPAAPIDASAAQSSPTKHRPRRVGRPVQPTH